VFHPILIVSRILEILKSLVPDARDFKDEDGIGVIYSHTCQFSVRRYVAYIEIMQNVNQTGAKIRGHRMTRANE
jgi:hypothetical protein